MTQHEFAAACLGRLHEMSAQRNAARRDAIYHFCMHLDERLRAFDNAVAQDVMHAIENMVYDVEVQLRNAQ